MIAGTCSDAGKSVINAGLCRVFLQDGFQPAPFKAQNMSLNSYATPEGLEIGRAQAVQAEACNVPCHVDMNPVLLKPTGDLNSQIVLLGKPIGNRSAKQYFKSDKNTELFNCVFDAFNRLSKRYHPIVLEGAGSIAELNLKTRDIVNMPMALRANASVILVADIDRGGVFASVYGSIMLLDEAEKKLIKGIIINKFRGDISLFDEGKKIIESITGVPVLGIIPWYNHIDIEDEDSVVLKNKNNSAIQGNINVGVIHLPQMSNFTDYNSFTRISEVNLFFSNDKNELEKADVIILPGSKNTISDFIYIKSKGIDKVITNAVNNGKSVIGICGGFQMLGTKISDLFGVEGAPSAIEGLGILSMETTIEKEKTTRQVEFQFRNSDAVCKGYEIHMGVSILESESESVNQLNDGTTDGIWLSNNVWGTYIHGIFDNAVVMDHILQPYLEQPISIEDHWHYKDRQYNLLADHLRKHIDMEVLYDVTRAL